MIKSLKGIVIISLLFASYGQIASDLYFPSLPNIAKALNTEITLVQLSVTVFMISYSIARLAYGPISDGIGRKKPLIIGFSLAFIGSIICLVANSISTLLIGRFIQGLGAASGSVLTAAVLRDMLEGKMLAKCNSYLAFINILFIASPPLLGGYIEELWGWRSAFTVLFIYTALILIVVFFLFPETNKRQDKNNIKINKIILNIKLLLTNRSFLGYSCLVMVGYATGIAWLTAGAVIIQQHLHYSPVAFGWFALIGGCSYCLGAIINTKTVMIFRSKTLIFFGSFLTLVSGLLILFFTVFSVENIYTVLLPVLGFYFGSSFIFPSSYSCAMTPYPNSAGSASAVLSAMQMLGGVLGSAFIALLPFPSFIKLGIVITLSGIVSLIAIILITRKYRLKLYYLINNRKVFN